MKYPTHTCSFLTIVTSGTGLFPACVSSAPVSQHVPLAPRPFPTPLPHHHPGQSGWRVASYLCAYPLVTDIGPPPHYNARAAAVLVFSFPIGTSHVV